MTHPSFAQAKRYALLEHFTQASCAPCAVQNPAFYDQFYDNQQRTHLIAYHPSWPGFDPMYNANEDEQDAMVSNYSISAVPNTVLNGELIGLPSEITEDMLRNTLPTNFRVRVWEGDDPDEPGNRLVRVTVQTVGTPERDEMRLRVAAVEKIVNYASPPGSNGERVFPYVFRRFVAGGSDGVILDVPDTGEEAVFEYSFPLDPDWDADEIISVAYVADRTSREVLNSGVMGDPLFEIAAGNQELYKIAEDTVTFDVHVMELGADSSEIEVKLEYETINGWDAYYTYRGQIYQDMDVLPAYPGTSVIRLHVITDGTAHKNTYRFEIDQRGSAISETIEFQVISPVEDLMVFHDADFVDPSVSPDLEAVLEQGKMTSEVNKSIVLSSSEWQEAREAEVLPGVKNIYLNTGWTFPPLTEDMIDGLDNHLDDGGNLLIAGQDIGQYIMTGGAPTSFRAFFFNTLNAQLQDNGNASLSHAEKNTEDLIFGTGSDIEINTSVYGGNFTRPDVLRTRNGSIPIFYYNGNEDEIAGLRSKGDDGERKIVYLGFGLEQVMFTNQLSSLLTISKNWFDGIISSTEFQEKIEASNWSVQPNPASDRILVRLNNADMPGLPVTYELVDGLGQRIKHGQMQLGVDAVPTAELSPGIYYFRWWHEKGISKAQEIIIQR